jgi:hypothetical protein
MNTGGTVHLRDGHERYDRDEVQKIEKNTSVELDRKIYKMLRDFETQAWLEAKVRNEQEA